MKKVVTTPTVDYALRTLGPDDVRRVHSWFDNLANWDGDPFVREKSLALDGVPGVRMLRTTTDLRIFFAIDGDTVTILDIATRQTILKTAAG